MDQGFKAFFRPTDTLNTVRSHVKSRAGSYLCFLQSNADQGKYAFSHLKKNARQQEDLGASVLFPVSGDSKEYSSRNEVKPQQVPPKSLCHKEPVANKAGTSLKLNLLVLVGMPVA
jgi:hypothetical protein